ncbi:MAG: SpoIIE family protein phosphatase [Lachnospiraceae bacterium]|nr:SpoIIE family protein phosphatase [Lachnospiraceae bacterium]
MKNRKVANTIAKKVTVRVLIVLLVSQFLLFAISYLLLQHIVSDNAKNNNEAMVTIFADMVLSEAFEKNVPIDENFAANILSLGNYICRLNNIEFAYLFVPEQEAGKIKYICVSQNSKVDEINPHDRYIGKVTSYTLTADERAVWNGEKEISHSVTVSKIGHEISTMVRITDPYGHPMMAGVDQSYEEMNRRVIRGFSILAVTTVLANCLIFFFISIVMEKRISVPAGKVCEVMSGYLASGSCSESKLQVDGNDELAKISAAFNSMTDNIQNYLSNISSLTKEQEKQNAQLDISSQIQRGFLKNGHFESGHCIIHADMIPARYVAGDLYDYMMIDDNHILTVIADVSGKGVAASIFMAVTLMLIREVAKMNKSPAEILKRVNDSLSVNNPSLLFLTAVIGIYDLKERTYIYCNAGHNLPYILRDRVIPLSGTRNPLLGIFPGEEFVEDLVTLRPGDAIFLYTDGVNEAVNESNEFFGTERLETALEEWMTSKTEDPVDYVERKMAEFTGNAERHDDTTMLCLLPCETEVLVLQPQIHEFAKLKQKILYLPLSRKELLDLCLAAEEIFVNICSYAYNEEIEKGDIRVSVRVSQKITIEFSDKGIPFDPTKNMISAEDYDIDEQIGGLGRLIAFRSVDDVRYERKNGSNILTLIKYI